MRPRTIAIRAWAVACALALGACRQPPAKTRGVGDRLQAFIIENCATRQRYCQVCAYAGKPTVFALGDLDDPALPDDLVRLQALVNARAEKGLVAFVLVGKWVGGKLQPFRDEAAAIARLAALGQELHLTLPLVVVPAVQTETQKRSYKSFDEAYDLAGSRTLLLADPSGKIRWAGRLTSDGAEAQLAQLETAASQL